MDDILTTLVITVIQVLLPVVLALIVAFLNEKIKEIKASRYGDEFDTAVAIINQLVLAAEQNGLRGALEAEGKVKKEFVLSQAQAELAKRGIKLDLKVIDALVEAQVHGAISQIEIPITEG